jgi:hypothetical protein
VNLGFRFSQSLRSVTLPRSQQASTFDVCLDLRLDSVTLPSGFQRLTVKHIQISGDASVALLGDESVATRSNVQQPLVFCAAHPRIGRTLLHLGDGMS